MCGRWVREYLECSKNCQEGIVKGQMLEEWVRGTSEQTVSWAFEELFNRGASGSGEVGSGAPPDGCW